MVLYRNGEIPPGVLHVYGSGSDGNGYYEWQSTAATWSRWLSAVEYARNKWGRAPRIRSGWNIFRPINIQRDARTRACNSGNCNGAAVAGYSSHGGNWNGRDCLAIDVDPNGLSWGQVDEAMRHAGFSVGLITQAISGIPGGEPWHYIDFNAFGPVPAGGGSTPFDAEEAELMGAKEDIINAIVAETNKQAEATRNIVVSETNKQHLVTRGEAQSMHDVTRGFTVSQGQAQHDITRKYLADWVTASVAKLYPGASLEQIRQAVTDAVGSAPALSDEQAEALGAQLAASAVAGIDAALRDDFEGVKARISQLPAETIAALKAAL